MLKTIRPPPTELADEEKTPPTKYIEDPVPLIAPPPYLSEGVTTFSYYLGTENAGHSTSTKFIEKYLNGPLGGTQRNRYYRVPSRESRPLLTFSTFEASASSANPDRVVSYKEVALQVPVIIVVRVPDKDDPGKKIEHSVQGFLPPVLFIDGPTPPTDEDCRIGSMHATSPIVVGRELFGLPKVPAVIDFQFSGTNLIVASVQYFGQTVIYAKGKDEPPEDGTAEARTREERRALAEKLFGPIDIPDDFEGDWAFGVTREHAALVDVMRAGHANPLIGLRQFRSPDYFKNAAGRAIVESPYEITSSGSSPASDREDPGLPIGNQVIINFTPELSSALELGESIYDIKYRTDGAVFRNVCTNFGEPASTVVTPAP